MDLMIMFVLFFHEFQIITYFKSIIFFKSIGQDFVKYSNCDCLHLNPLEDDLET
jgi:hypothetical protein